MAHRPSRFGRYICTRLAILLIGLIAYSCAGHQRLGVSLDKAALVSTRKIFLGDLGAMEGSGLIREKIRILLLNSNRFTLVDSPDSADATLTGAVGLSSSIEDLYEGQALVRLVESVNHRVIWAHEYRPGFLVRGLMSKVSTSVAEQIVEQLIEDAGSL